MHFRYDINGLRAIAVLAVVFFHFTPQWLPGGFTGVDVFFVISGFLMTSIIFSGVEKNNFNLFRFYNARVNRIIPVLAAMSAVLLVFGWFYLAPDDYRNLGRQIEKASYFASNLLFAKGSGYFDTGEHTKWLLHTWSLSVEWQFYIFFPIIILALKKYLSFEKVKLTVLLLFLISFIYCIFITSRDTKTAYFLLTSRAWEMLIGGLAFLYPWSFKQKNLQVTAQCFGLILVFLSYFFISKDTPWPGYMALIPVFGAYLIIVSRYQNNVLLNNLAINNIGKWSYSIYVWHWPLVVFGLYFTLNDWWMYGIPLSILLGFLSYQFIEKINFARFVSWKDIYKVKPFYMFLFIVLCGYTVKETQGMKFHYSEEILNIVEPPQKDLNQICNFLSNNKNIEACTIGNSSNIKAIIVGDSHAASLLSSFSDQINLRQEGIISLSTSGCPYILNASFNSTYSYCTDINKIRFEYLSKIKNTPIVIINRYLQRMEGDNDPTKENRQIIFFKEKNESKNFKYESFRSNFEKTICHISKQNPVFIVQSIPEQGKNVPQLMVKNLLLKNGKNDPGIPYSEYQKRSYRMNNLLESAAKRCGAKILSPAEILCKSGKCISQYQGKPIYSDDNHLNEYGSNLLAPMLKKALN